MGMMISPKGAKISSWKAIPLASQILQQFMALQRTTVYKQTCSVSVVLKFPGEVQRGNFNGKKKKKKHRQFKRVRE